MSDESSDDVVIRGDDAPEDEPGEGPGELGSGHPPAVTDPAPAGEEHLRSIIETLVFVADGPVPAKKIARHAHARLADVVAALEQLAEEYRGRGIELVEVGNGWQFRSAVKNAPFVRSFIAQRPVRLTRAQLETLAIISYRQPVTRPEMEEIRGVDCGSGLKVLLDRGLVKILGRKEEPGRPLLYGTTPWFLEFFGLKSLSELPTLKEFSELSEESRALFERKMGEPFDLREGEDTLHRASEEDELGEDDPGFEDDEPTSVDLHQRPPTRDTIGDDDSKGEDDSEGDQDAEGGASRAEDDEGGASRDEDDDDDDDEDDDDEDEDDDDEDEDDEDEDEDGDDEG